MKAGRYLLLTALAFLLAGCLSTEKAPVTEAANTEKQAKENRPDREKPAEGKKAAATKSPFSQPPYFTVSLEANPSTGFSWICDVANPAVAELTDRLYAQEGAASNKVGAAGTEDFVFTCKEAGCTGLTFTYRRPWQGGETAEVRRAQLIVNDSLQAKIIFF